MFMDGCDVDDVEIVWEEVEEGGMEKKKTLIVSCVCVCGSRLVAVVIDP